MGLERISERMDKGKRKEEDGILGNTHIYGFL